MNQETRKKLTFKGNVSRMGDKRVVVIPREIAVDLECFTEQKLRITLIIEKLHT